VSSLSAPPTVRAFGPLRVVLDGVERELRRRRERNVLATLVAARGRPVSADRLAVEVWGAEAPPKALASLQVAVSRLRALLEPNRVPRSPARWLLSTAAGYSIGLSADAVDVWAFESLVDRAIAADGPAERHRMADEACAAWVDEPFPGCDTDMARREADRLAELHLVAQEIRAQALLELDEPQRAAAALVPLLQEQPYRERLWTLLARAQYHCARQSDALATLRALRTRLADELGIEPSPEVVRLERALLHQDESVLGGSVAGFEPVATPGAATSTGSPAGLPSAPRTAGREAALVTVRGIVDRLTGSGTAGVLLVSGEPGIGKSRLIEDLAHLARADRVQVMVGRCHADFAPALWPWLPIVRRLYEEVPDASDDGVLRPVLSDAAPPVETDGGAVLRLFDAVMRLLSRAAARRPLVVVLEDLHWADVTSLRLLAHVVVQARTERLLLVGTRRTSDAPTSDALIATLADLARAGAVRVRLEGLAGDGVSALLTEVLGPHDPRLDLVVADATGGNPFFALEYARLIQGLRETDPARLPVPEGVRDVLRQRVARLPTDARVLLMTAAVVGRTIDAELLSELTGTPADVVLDLLDLALASGILADRRDGYAFAHALTRDAIAAEVSAARRMHLHDRVSRALEDRHPNTPDLATEIAHHAYLAAPLGPAFAARAVTVLARAARVAESRQAHDEALALWQQVHDTASGGDRVAAMAGAAYALLRLGRTAQARAAVVDAVHLARELNRWDQVADVVSILNRGGVWGWRQHGRKDQSFVATLHEALSQVDDGRQARLLAALQMEHSYAWERELADEVGKRSLQLARRCGDEALLHEVLLVNILASFGPGKAPARLSRIEELRRHNPRGELAVFVEFFYARTLYECARVAEADAATVRCAAAIAQLRHTGVEVPFAWWRLARARDRDDNDAAESAKAMLRRHHRDGMMANAELDVYYALRVARQGAPVDRALAAATAAAPAGMRALIAYAVLEEGEGSAAKARNVLGDPAPPGASDYSVLAGHCLRVAVLAVAGDMAGLHAAIGRIEEYSGDVVTYGSLEHLGAVDYFIALGYAALGDQERARRHCAVALQQLERLDTRLWLRRAQALSAVLTPAP
jgi:DNA-binding SARP family transcriptional activator